LDPDGEVVGTDIDDAMLAAAKWFLADEGLSNVVLKNDDLFATRLEPASFNLVHASSSSRRWAVATSRWKPMSGCSTPAAPRLGEPRLRILALQSSGEGMPEADRAHLRGVRTLGRRRNRAQAS
jgi:hypothetical protein